MFHIERPFRVEYSQSGSERDGTHPQAGAAYPTACAPCTAADRYPSELFIRRLGRPGRGGSRWGGVCGGAGRGGVGWGARRLALRSSGPAASPGASPIERYCRAVLLRWFLAPVPPRPAP